MFENVENRNFQRIEILHNFTEQTGNNCRNKRGNKCTWNCIEKFFNLGLRKIDRCNIENSFAAAHDNRSTARNVTVGAIGCENVVEKSKTPAPREWAKKNKFANLGWDSKKIENRGNKFSYKIGYPACSKKRNRNHDCNKIGKN